MSAESRRDEFTQPTASTVQYEAHRVAANIVRSDVDKTATGLKHEFERHCDRIARRYPVTGDVGYDEWIPKARVSLGAFFGNELFPSDIADAFLTWVSQHDQYSLDCEEAILAVERFPDRAILIEAGDTGSWWAFEQSEQNEVVIPIDAPHAVASAVEQYGHPARATGRFARPQGDPMRTEQ